MTKLQIIKIPESVEKQTLGHLLSHRRDMYMRENCICRASVWIDTSHRFKKIHDFGDIGLAESCIEYLGKSHQKSFFMVALFDNMHNICQYVQKQPLPLADVVEPRIEECPNLPGNFTSAPYKPDQVRSEQAVVSCRNFASWGHLIK